MNLGHVPRAAARVLTSRADGPTLYDLCDPILRGSGPGDAHLRRFYGTALGNLALRPVLGRAGLPQLRDPARLAALRAALLAARDEAEPDWRSVAAPVAALLDELPLPAAPPRAPAPRFEAPAPDRLDAVAHACAAHLLKAHARDGFIPGYAAFNLAGDPDFTGRDLLTALEGLGARTYRNATLLFNLARCFVLGSPPVAALLNPPWRGIAEPMWAPVQIRHRSAYYDAFYVEALLDYAGSGLASAAEAVRARAAVDEMVRFCLVTSREEVPSPGDEGSFGVVTALAPPPHARFSAFFQHIKRDLGFGLYVPDCDTTACAVSAATRAGSSDPLLDQPLVDFYAGYQVGRSDRHPPTVAINGDVVDHRGGVATWIENAAGDRPFGNDLDPTLNLDILEVSFRNLERWRVLESPARVETVRRILAFQRRLVAGGAFANPRAHIYYLPELYAAYAGRTYAAFMALPAASRAALDPGGDMEAVRTGVLAYVRDELLTRELNPFDAALALLALAKLGAGPASFAPALAAIAAGFGEGGRRGPFRAYEWNKMKTPTRILVGGPEVTSAFVLSALVHARGAARAG